MARQKMGQHFLSGESWQKRILATLPRNSDEVWLEIGAGHGEMTRSLASEGRRVIAVEGDERLAEGLRAAIRSEPKEWLGVEVVGADVLTLDLGRLVGTRFRVYGNLPYYITSPILHQLFKDAGQIASIHVVMQLEVAERIVAEPRCRAYGYLSVACQFYTQPQIAFKIPPGAFRPPPRVTSALVRMTLPGEGATLRVGDDAQFLKFVQLCFAQKRKTLRNNLLSIASDARIHAAMESCGLRPDARAEQLSLAHFAALAKLLVEI
jgi:16S rRNA (adenine1518-N6/adenine1519-N6)-dimethyltransferase